MANQKQVQTQAPQKPQEKTQKPNQFIWVVLGIAAIFLFWLLSSWVYK